jgi:hypothetical protein
MHRKLTAQPHAPKRLTVLAGEVGSYIYCQFREVMWRGVQNWGEFGRKGAFWKERLAQLDFRFQFQAGTAPRPLESK